MADNFGSNDEGHAQSSSIPRNGTTAVRGTQSGSTADEGLGRQERIGVRNEFSSGLQAEPMERVRIVKLGVPASVVDVIAQRMAMPKERLASTLGLDLATIDRKSRENKPLSSDDSSRVLGMARLVGQVQVIVEESGDPHDFNAAEWVARWLEPPLALLAGQRPADLMDTFEGQGIVSQIVARMQSGAYS